MMTEVVLTRRVVGSKARRFLCETDDGISGPIIVANESKDPLTTRKFALHFGVTTSRGG